MMNNPVNPTPPPNMPMEEVPIGITVYDANGNKVGAVTFSALRDGYFVVEKGFLFTHELFLPTTAIQARDLNGLTLRLTKDELKDDQWKQPPSGMNTATTQPSVYPNSPLPEDRAVNAAPAYPEEPMPNVGPVNTSPPYPDAPMPNVGPMAEAPIYSDSPMPNVGPVNTPPPYPDAPMSNFGPASNIINPEDEPPLIGH